MGCDIHLFAETRVDGAWVSADTWAPDEDAPWLEGVPRDDRLYRHRSYILFAALANVRNYHDVVTPIAEPRGLPDDCDPRVRARSEYWAQDGHSHSWFTLSELKAYDWEALKRADAFGFVDMLSKWDSLMLRLSAMGAPDDVRIVFWFDN